MPRSIAEKPCGKKSSLIQKTIEAETNASAAKAARDVATENEKQARAAEKTAIANEARALAALSRTATNENHFTDAVKLALAAWPRSAADERPQSLRTIDALALALSGSLEVSPPLQHDDAVWSAAFSPDGPQVVTGSEDSTHDNTARVWDAATGAARGWRPHHRCGVGHGHRSADRQSHAARQLGIRQNRAALGCCDRDADRQSDAARGYNPERSVQP